MSDPGTPTYLAEYDHPTEVYVVRRPRERYWLNALLLLATIFTTLLMGARMEFNFLHNQPAFLLDDTSLPFFPVTWAVHPVSNLLLGVPFAATLMLILLAHEMGHYLACVYYGVSATLPFFIPFPTLFGTMGAFIRIRSPIRSRKALFDIAIAGPIAGFVVALAVLAVALGLSKPMTSLGSSEIELGYPLIFSAMHKLLAATGVAHGTAALPFNQVLLHPMAIAAWVGMFATALNLLPGGQLDGGHLIFALTPHRHRAISRATIIALIPLAYYGWMGWLLWAVVLRITGMRHPIVIEYPGLGGARRWLAVFALLMFVLTFAPAPLAHSSIAVLLRR